MDEIFMSQWISEYASFVSMNIVYMVEQYNQIDAISDNKGSKTQIR